MSKKNLYIILGACILIFGLFCFFGGYISGRRSSDSGSVGSSSELYQDSLEQIEELRGELETSERLNDKLTGQLGDLERQLDESREGINNSQSLVSSSLTISGDIKSDSGTLGDIIGKSTGDSTDIGTASRGLAELFGIDGEEE